MATMKNVAEKICEMIYSRDRRQPEPYDTTAEVRRVENGKAYVHLPGGIDETPVALTIDAAPGDMVQVRVADGAAWLVGNRTAPPTDDTTARAAQKTAEISEHTAEEAQTTASEAKQIADDTEQHFWFTEIGADTGAHIAEITKDEWDVTPSGGNLLARSNGIAVRKGTTELASFGSSGAQIGQSDDTHLEMDYHSMQLIDNEGNTFFHVSDLRSNHIADDEYGEGFYAVVTETYTGDGAQTSFQLSNISFTVNYKIYVNGIEESNVTKNAAFFRFTVAPADGSIVTATYPTADQTVKAYTAGLRENGGDIGIMSFAEGIRTTASGRYAHAEGYHATARGSASHTEGIATTASGDYAHAEGVQATASGTNSHAEGSHTTASGSGSHAEGFYNTASGTNSHAEGSHTTASGSGSHAEGESTTASGMDSHVQNFRTIAGYNYQTAIGKYNNNKSGDLFEIGNGTADSARANAFEVDNSGNATVAGNLTASNIGAKNWVAPSSVSCQSGKWYKVAEVELDAGIWFIDCNALFPKTNATGTRQIRVTTETFSDGTTTAPASYGNITNDILEGANTAQYPQSHFPVDISSRTTFRLAAYQGSESTMSVTGRMYATRIK